MLTRLHYRIHTSLERILPERRLFLKSDSDTRFIRLRPVTQLAALAGGTLLVSWTILATSIVLMDSVTAGGTRDQTQRQQALYESRLNALSADRDRRADEAVRAQERFNLALAEVSKMQTALLATEDRRKELETGIEVLQDTLIRTIKERDDAREESERVTVALAEQTGSARTDGSRMADAEATLDQLSTTLAATARQRDDMANAVLLAKEETEEVLQEKAELQARNDLIFGRLEEAVTVSMEPLDKMFRAAGLSTDSLLKQVRRGYSGQGGPLSKLTVSTMGGADLTPEERRANEILNGLDRMNLYRLAATKAPFSMPVKTAFRYTSGFGGRDDPFGRGKRRHEGIDMAGASGSPIYATADGVVIQAGTASGYGKVIKIRHEFGIQTVYGHLSRIRVEKGQRVSRGDRIGDMGSTGRSTGTHLHYEVRVDGSPVNPMTFIKAAKDVF
ncbi:M23 family metallopeptidase [Cereibacter johrii]|uniref:Murein DD-endopeptidase MepM/ murein hydrolase activator NlpD n=1 Tax=Cereibacter johrii TaxID=445629 RepID=A0ABX5JCZ7_9RHOB|nr:M23 family metallopeptidase [Cereibacter johrii]QCP85395.1 M23 family peptidase [Cereibacter sphaeroides]RDS94269.1 M23 family peptidase [Cereibacter sphaeroides f. sp. denitrificans]MEA5160773.1 M23 family metallopeptidase [Cereibacter johrii]ODM42522.1 peptidase M23 [Cereibacter johrii]PTM80230.1 murein DD-endopeptidase MepM/ murein hydrolase activator NlpD [Cereibacter johrii]